MKNYRLTCAADSDFEAILEFGIDRFGFAQAEIYQRGMIDQFSRITENPLHYSAVDDIRPGYHRCVYRSHAIYFQIKAEEIVIVRILGRQDVDDAFEESDEDDD